MVPMCMAVRTILGYLMKLPTCGEHTASDLASTELESGRIMLEESAWSGFVGRLHMARHGSCLDRVDCTEQ
jgi:hypothetical protein